MNPRWLLRMSKWARNPPSEKQVKFFLGIFVVVMILFTIEYIWGAPEWMQLTRMRNPIK